MRRVLISLMFVLMFVSCGGIDTSNIGDCSGDFTNYHKGLCWSDASSSSINWDKAVSYCEDLGGRLPTISELRTLIQNCPGTETGGECGVTDSCLSYEDCRNDQCFGCEGDNSVKFSVFEDTHWCWSSLELSDRTDYAWGVYFNNGSVGYTNKKNNGFFVRCVE